MYPPILLLDQWEVKGTQQDSLGMSVSHLKEARKFTVYKMRIYDKVVREKSLLLCLEQCKRLTVYSCLERSLFDVSFLAGHVYHRWLALWRRGQ